MLMAYVVVSLLLLNPPLDPVGSGTNNISPRIRSAESVDAIVFVALGPAARSNSLLYALSSLREKGRWDGPVYVIVGRADDLVCLNSHLAQPVSVIPTSASHDDAEGEGAGPAVDAKMIKMRLLELLPPSIERVVYIDCDIITKRSIGPFLQEVGRLWREVDRNKGGGPGEASGAVPSHLKGGGGGLPPAAGDNDQPSTLLIFPDAAGHTIRACSGCDEAHSGVVSLARGHSERCLELWREAFLGGGKDGRRTATDQEAMDIALREGSGCEARWVDRSHMHFMKDPFVMLGLTKTSTFAHFTSLLHPERLSGSHRRYYEWSLGRSFNEWGEIELKACASDH